jgi:hypothetical protein
VANAGNPLYLKIARYNPDTTKIGTAIRTDTTAVNVMPKRHGPSAVKLMNWSSLK